jgi:hypothetical protein
MFEICHTDLVVSALVFIYIQYVTYYMRKEGNVIHYCEQEERKELDMIVLWLGLCIYGKALIKADDLQQGRRRRNRGGEGR